jgi:hypothetical protein
MVRLCGSTLSVLVLPKLRSEPARAPLPPPKAYAPRLATAQLRLISWCRHQVEPDPGEMATRYGAETSVLDWRQRLVCSQCGGLPLPMLGVPEPLDLTGPWGVSARAETDIDLKGHASDGRGE